MRRRNGFTLIEVLVTIAAIAILLLIGIPSLRGALIRSKEVGDLANLRSTHQQFFEWGVAHRNRFVNLGPPPQGEIITLSAGPGNGFLVGDYLAQCRYWPLILSAWGLSGSPSWHSRLASIPAQPGNLGRAAEGGRYVRSTDLVYSLTLLTNPARWTSPACALASDAGARYNQFVSWNQVAFPAAKGLMIDSLAASSPVSPVCFIDGSARNLDLASWLGTEQAGCPQEYFTPVVATPYGYLGRDF